MASVTSVFEPPIVPEGFYHVTVERLVGQGRGPRALEVLAVGEESARHQGLHEEVLSCLVDGARVLLVCGSRDEAVGVLHGATAVLPHVEDPEMIVSAWRDAVLLSPDGPRIVKLIESIVSSGTWTAHGAEREMAIFAVLETALDHFERGHLAAAAVLHDALARCEAGGEVFGVPYLPRVDLATVLRTVGCVRAAAEVIVDHDRVVGEQGIGSPVLLALTYAERVKLWRTAGNDDAAREADFELESVAREALSVLETRSLEMARSDATRWSGRGPGSHLVVMLRRWEQVAEALGGYAAVAARSSSPGEVLTAIDPLGDRERRRATLDLVIEAAESHHLRRCAERMRRVREYAE
jgi:hypothetical protein